MSRPGREPWWCEENIRKSESAGMIPRSKMSCGGVRHAGLREAVKNGPPPFPCPASQTVSSNPDGMAWQGHRVTHYSLLRTVESLSGSVESLLRTVEDCRYCTVQDTGGSELLGEYPVCWCSVACCPTLPLHHGTHASTCVCLFRLRAAKHITRPFH